MTKYKKEKIISAFKEGAVDGICEFGDIPEYIETQISHIFLFSEYVYKIYKWDNDNFNKYFVNLSDHHNRECFYKKDFLQNYYFSKNIYLNIKGIKVFGDKVIVKEDIYNCDDLVIEMRRINAEYNLTKLILNKKLSEYDSYIIGYKLTEMIDKFIYRPNFNTTYYQLLKSIINNIKKFSCFFSLYINKDNIDEIISELQIFINRKRKYLEQFDSNKLVVSVDSHSDNVFFDTNKIIFIDAYPPVGILNLTDPLFNITRLSTDIMILGEENLYKNFVNGYKDYYKIDTIDKDLELFYHIISALIRSIYLYDLSGIDTQRKCKADRYWGFVKDKIYFLSF